jgi:HlyD family secretion protein
VAAVVLLLVLLPGWLRPGIERDLVRLATVERGTVEATVQAAGTVIPAFESVLSSPVEARVVKILKRPGDRVEVGEEILTLDTSGSQLDLARRADRYAQKENEQGQLRLKLERELIELNGHIERQRLDAEVLEARAEQNRTLRKDGLVSKETLYVAEVEARKAKIDLKQLEDQVGTARRSTDAQLAGLGLDLEILAKELTEARRQLELATTRATRAGVVTWVFNEEGGTVRSGSVVARIADPESFRVEATASDIHSARLAAGLPVQVRLDAQTLAGRVATVYPSVENGAVKFAVDLAEPKNPKLRNNLRVDVFVVTAVRPGALRVQNGPFAPGTGSAEVFVVQGSEAARRTVRFGLAGADYLEVLDGLAAGDEVIVSDLRDYLHLTRIRLK